MRLHHLTMQAFGPFPGTEEVDFDELSDAGLFLLTGPTGAGKTTILDAVCFALYGSVPGVRGVKALKSQHAPDDARPEVVLDFSVRDRRFVLRRSPEWTRPKRRGEGFTTQNATATLVEVTSGEDHLLSSRAQEVGHFVGELIGMQATQFVQVAMLPQGDFQKFLRASSQDRHGVLQHLFKTDRYARIEDWVHDHSRELRERSDLGRQAVVRVLDTVAERAAVPLPEDLGGAALDAPEAETRALAWVDALLTDAEVGRTAAAAEHAVAAEEGASARAALEQGRALSAVAYLEARRLRRLVRAGLDETLRGVDALLLPTTPVPAPLRGTAQVSLESGEVPQRTAFLRLTVPFNVTGLRPRAGPPSRRAPRTTSRRPRGSPPPRGGRRRDRRGSPGTRRRLESGHVPPGADPARRGRERPVARRGGP